jgi:hypothetical protein
VNDRIVLTLPADGGFEAVAQLVLGGVAARLNLTYENLDDLGTALETLLERRDDGELTVELELDDDAITTTIGPLNERELTELERRVLETVTDSFDAVARDGGHWVQLRKSVDRAGEPA